MGIFEKIAVAAALAAAILVPTLHRQVEKSKVVSADVSAKEVIQTVNTWIWDDVAAGGKDRVPCELRIVMDNGKATVTDSTGKNEWDARDARDGWLAVESLKERFEWDFSRSTFTAAVFVDESGYAVYSWCVQNDAGYNGDAPSLADFKAGEYEWISEDKVGITRDGAFVGTYPHLFYKES
ncbi:MAG: hypothetical protein K2J77_01885 [Oscillospiraceae bacterium]|nr:hypothetical protein [Oscillospiraceae bacterium]